MKRFILSMHVGIIISAGLAVCAAGPLWAAAGRSAGGELPKNLALKAKATADSQYSGTYAAGHAIDGKIPDPLGSSDADAAWAVDGQTHRNGAELTLTWPEPVTVAEVVYYGRTAWQPRSAHRKASRPRRGKVSAPSRLRCRRY